VEPAAIWGALVKMKTKLLASGMALCFLAACGSKEPDCGSSETTSAIKELLKKRPNNKLITYVFNNAEEYKMLINERFIRRNIADDHVINNLIEQLEQTSEQSMGQLEQLASKYYQLKQKCYKNEANIFSVQTINRYCGELSDTADLGEQIAKSRNALFGDSSIYKGLDAAQKAYYDAIKNEFESIYKSIEAPTQKIKALRREIDVRRLRFNEEESQREVLENNERQAKIKDMRQNAIQGATYKPALIRTLSKDIDARAVSCIAQISVTVLDWGSADVQANYMAQYTSDDKLYVEIGL
jgi:hypothetical protein